MKLFFFVSFFLISTNLFAQVGIGTTSPTAELEIETTDTGIPALELNPQTTPTGSADGQLAVIGDKLYMYDKTRGKWLSVSETGLQFGMNGNNTNTYLGFGGFNRATNSGAPMPFNGTIVGVSAIASGGLATKGFEVNVKKGTTLESTVAFNLVSNEYIATDINQDFNAGDYINVFVVAAGTRVREPVVIVWVKWRK